MVDQGNAPFLFLLKSISDVYLDMSVQHIGLISLKRYDLRFNFEFWANKIDKRAQSITT